MPCRRPAAAGVFIFLLTLLATPAHGGVRPAAPVELLPGDPAPHPDDVLWEPMRIPAFSPRGLPLGVAGHQGKLVMVGSFGAIGRTRTLGAVAWDGSSFERLGTPKVPRCQAVLDWNGALLVSLGSSSSTVHEELFQWNGTEWDSVATANGAIVAMTVHQGGVVVIGTFTVIGGVAANRVAWFDGTSWQAMGAGIPVSFATGTNPPIASVGSDVYVHATGVPSIYRYTGGTWTTDTGNGLNGQVNSFATDGVNLYVAGGFTKAGPDSVPGIGRWDGSAWHRVGVGTPSFVFAVTWWNGQLVAGMPDGTSMVSAFDGTHWYGLGDATGVSVNRLDTVGSLLVARVEYRPPTGAMADIRVFDGATWTDVADSWGPDMIGTWGYTNSARVVNDLLYVCGANRTSANQTGAIRTNNVSAWNGSAWSALGPGVGQQPMHVGEWQGDLIVSGRLFVPNSANVARWDGATWSALTDFTSGLDFYAWSTTSFHDSLCGASDQPVKTLSGSTWSVVGSGGGTYGPTFDLLDWNDRLVATGAFTQADGLPASRIAAWDGTQWALLGAGLDGNGVALYAFGGDLLVGGDFTTAGGQPAEGVARWDGSTWHAMGTRARYIRDFTEIAGVLYAVGVFQLADDSRVNSVARWTGTDWQLLGSGVPYTFSTYPDDAFSTMTIDWVEGYQGDLYCGGFLSFAFGQVSSCIMRLPAANTVAVGDDLTFRTTTLLASPNPGRANMAFTFTLPHGGRTRLAVYDAAGRRMVGLLDGQVLAGRHDVRWDSPARPGVYFARLDAPGGERRVVRFVRLE